jgi:GTP cyclohydrolase II
VEANRRLGFAADRCNYRFVGTALKKLKVSKVRLLSNNPEKIAALEKAGVEVVERVPCQPAVRKQNRSYLKAKKKKLGHLLTV